MEKEENQNSNSDSVEEIKDNEDTDKSNEKSEDLQPDNKIDWSIARFRNINLSFEVMLSPLLFNLRNKQINQTKILAKCSELIDNNNLKIYVSSVLPLKSAIEAHKKIQNGHTLGKIVLEIK